jgi:hypothetical protein
MKNVSVYDNNGETLDRYTIIDLNPIAPNTFIYVAAGNSPKTFWQHGEIKKQDIGKHLGKKIAFESLPTDVQNQYKSEI